MQRKTVPGERETRFVLFFVLGSDHPCLFHTATADKIHPLPQTVAFFPTTAKLHLFPANQKAHQRRGQELCAGKYRKNVISRETDALCCWSFILQHHIQQALV